MGKTEAAYTELIKVDDTLKGNLTAGFSFL